MRIPQRFAAVVAGALAMALGSAPGHAAMDPVELEAYVDGLVTTAMEDRHIAGIVVSIVEDGEIVLEKGYGYAREPEGVPADPQRSLFRVASISKTFNATALMQLVEQGHVDLEADISRYLPDIEFDLPYGPVRVGDLISHSAGFEDAYFGHFWAVDAASDHTLEHYVATYQPAQVRPPGELVVYSNYGTAVAGLIVERVSGEPYAVYMKRQVLDPLGMTRSRFEDWTGMEKDGDLSAALEVDLAHAHQWSGGRYTRQNGAWMHDGMMPAGGLLTTAHEMTYWMRAHLGDGAFNGGRILRPETLARMHEVLRRNHPAVGANLHGFWSGRAAGYDTLRHGGSIFGFLSSMDLVPELGVGLFVSTNAPTGRPFVMDFSRRVLQRFHPREATETPTEAAGDIDLEAYVGEYHALRTGYSTVLKFAALFAPTQVGVNGEGALAISDGSTTRRYRPLGEDLFESPDDGARIAFERNAQGEPFRFYSTYGNNIYDRASFLQSGTFMAGIVALLAVGCIGVVVGAWLRRREALDESSGERWARSFALMVVPVWIAGGVTFAGDMGATSGMQPPHFAHFPTASGWIWISAGWVMAALSVGLAVCLVPVWRHGTWPVWRRLRFSAFTLLCVSFVGLLAYWNLLGAPVLG